MPLLSNSGIGRKNTTCDCERKPRGASALKPVAGKLGGVASLGSAAVCEIEPVPGIRRSWDERQIPFEERHSSQHEQSSPLIPQTMAITTIKGIKSGASIQMSRGVPPASLRAVLVFLASGS